MTDRIIFWDLDQNLVDNTMLSPTEESKTFVLEMGKRHETYHSIINPLFVDALNKMREMGLTCKMLTAATKDYAILTNDLQSLGFAEEDIYARGDYTNSKMSGYSFKGECLNEKGILIDDARINNWSPWPHYKMDFVGDCLYLQTPGFYGGITELNKHLFEDSVNKMFEMIENN